MVSGHASSHPRGFQFGIEPLSQLDVFPRRSASREDIKLRYRFKPHWNPLGCEEAWSDTIISPSTITVTIYNITIKHSLYYLQYHYQT